MNIVAVNGSPNAGRGSTATLLGFVLEGARGAGADTEVINLASSRVLPCRSCDRCHTRGGCPQIDEFEAIRRRIMEADALVLASPNLVSNVSAQMKAFIDRCSGVIHTMAFRGRYGAVVVTSGGDDQQTVADYLRRVLLMTGVVPTGWIGARTGGRLDADIPAAARRRATELGRRLVRQSRSGEVDEASAEFLERFERKMRQLVEVHRDEWLFEAAYWRQRSQETAEAD